MAAMYNLTANDLANSAHYDQLRNLFVDVASSPTNSSSLSGHVFFDVNDNGIRDSVESAIGNVKITLTGTNDQGQLIHQTAMTEADGSYAFFGLRPGTYTISQTQPEFVLDGQDSVGSAGGSVENDQLTILLNEGTDGRGYDFGERGRPSDSIGLIDFLSSNSADGMTTAAEAGTENHWFCLEGSWREFQFAHVKLSDDGSKVTISVRDTHGHDYQNVFDTIGSQNVQPLTKNATYQNLRITEELTKIITSSATMTEDVSAEEESSHHADGDETQLTPMHAFHVSTVPTNSTVLTDTIISNNSVETTLLLSPTEPSMEVVPSSDRVPYTTPHAGSLIDVRHQDTDSSLEHALAIDELMTEPLWLDELGG